MKTPNHHKRTVIVFLLCLCLPTTSVLAFFGGFSGIVFDPTNFIENVRQAAALLEQISRASRQITLQHQMLAQLPISVGAGLDMAASELDGELRASTAFISDSVDDRYPITFSDPTPGWPDAVQPEWIEAERQALLHEQRMIARVQAELAPAAGRIAQLIDGSNGAFNPTGDAPGVMAVAQAQQELLSVCSSEADKLIAVRAVRMHRRVEAHARLQSQAAYHTARREHLLNDWTTANAKAVRQVRSPF